ncbi:ANTAR domain-containing protein, partial [Streptomyces sp. NPDC059556]|uniref:ANTAR domain-containing protein n=1 Tax=Streptomyces sp. NPDC059556 TaxID=3346863 RepID=UPI00369495CD
MPATTPENPDAPETPADGSPPSHDERPPTRGDCSDGRLSATVERLRGEVRAAHAAIEGRALIELAKGVLVERLGCGPAQAARQLAELADRAGLSRLELAADIINQAARDQGAGGARAGVGTTTRARRPTPAPPPQAGPP